AVKRGEADSIAKNPKITDGDRLAFGYISPDGIAQIANVLGVKYGSEASDEPEIQSAVSGILPQILRNSVKEVVWQASKREHEIEDRFSITIDTELANIFSETLKSGPAANSPSAIFDVIPISFQSVTLYNLENPQIAWRSLLLAATRKMESLTGSLVVNFLQGLFEPYGVEDPEKFLGSIKSRLLTVRLNDDDENVAVVTESTAEDFYKSITKTIDFKKPPDEQFEEGQYRKSKDGTLAFINRVKEFEILGNTEAVSECSRAYGTDRDWANDPVFAGFLDSRASAVSVSLDAEIARRIVEVLAESNTVGPNAKARILTETSFNKTGIERRTVSDFGFIGWIITQFGKEQ
ncbi:MAG: hypothetical protein ACJ72Z_06215, partial [Pyrinomonadaceae bacterium]